MESGLSKLGNRFVYCILVIAIVAAMTGAAKANLPFMPFCDPFYHGVYVGCSGPVHGLPA